MYLTNSSVKNFNNPRKLIIKRQPLSVSPLEKNDYSVDSISVDSYDRMSSPQQKIISSSNVTRVQSVQLNPRNIVSTAKDITSPPWYKTSKCWLIPAGILAGVVCFIVLPTVLAVVLSRNPSVVTTVTAATIVQTAAWNFDGNVNDLNNTYNGVLGAGAAYGNITYFGYGYSLVLNNSFNSFVNISSPFFNLSYTSFTVEAWIYLLTIAGDNAIFSQCACGTCQSQCLSLIVRSGKLYMAFSLNVLIGTTTMSVNTWYHVAYVYDYSSRTQSVYVQGVLDATKTSSDPYQGESGAIYIGISNISSSFYNGYIDYLEVTTMAKPASDLLTDASLVAHFSFDSSTLTQDTGPNQISGYMQNANAVTGKVSQALSLSGTSSYFQAYAFYQLSQQNKEFSFALWINPNSATGTLVQRTRLQSSTSGPCSIFITFSTIGQIVFAMPTAAATTVQIVGPFILVGQWTHLGYTYSQTNGLTMYINGTRYGATGSYNYYSMSSNYDWLNIGQYITTLCTTLSLVSNGVYSGAIDEFYVYRRELSASTIASLAND